MYSEGQLIGGQALCSALRTNPISSLGEHWPGALIGKHLNLNWWLAWRGLSSSPQGPWGPAVLAVCRRTGLSKGQEGEVSQEKKPEWGFKAKWES